MVIWWSIYNSIILFCKILDVRSAVPLFSLLWLTRWSIQLQGNRQTFIKGKHGASYYFNIKRYYSDLIKTWWCPDFNNNLQYFIRDNHLVVLSDPRYLSHKPYQTVFLRQREEISQVWPAGCDGKWNYCPVRGGGRQAEQGRGGTISQILA